MGDINNPINTNAVSSQPNDASTESQAEQASSNVATGIDSLLVGQDSRYKSVFLKTLQKDIEELGTTGKSVKFFSRDLQEGGKVQEDKENKNPNITFGTSPGYFLENIVFLWLTAKGADHGYTVTHMPQGSTFDYEITNTRQPQKGDIFKASKIYVDCKSGLKAGNAQVSKNQNNYKGEESVQITDPDTDMSVAQTPVDNKVPKFIIFLIYRIVCGTLSYSFVIDKSYFMPIEYAQSNKGYVTHTNYNKITMDYINKKSKVGSIYESCPMYSNKIGDDGKFILSSQGCSEYLNLMSINESKKRVMVKKFIEENFNKRGEYLYPKDGDSKCSFHEEYDKGLLKFFAEHGIKKIMSVHDSHAPSLGFSEDEQKWYGWSHRAIYGFGIGSTAKSGDCGYDAMKKAHVTKAKTLDDAKKMAELFAKDVS
jgi:hypothetical protein